MDQTNRAFEAFGQQFLAQFAPLPPSRKRKAPTSSENPTTKRQKVTVDDILPPQKDEEEESEDEDSESDGDSIEDLNEEGNVGATSKVSVVVFEPEKYSKSSKQDKSFMSSKISKVRSSEKVAAPSNKKSKKDQAEELESMQNDRSLYKLIHTKLLSASLEGPSEGDGAKRKKSLEGRVLELTKNAKLGKGEGDVRRAEHNKAPRHIREGIIAKQKEKREKKLQEAKDLGNYHPTIKRLLSDPDKVSKPKKRERGLGMGIGSFRGGILTLGKQDIQRGQGPSSFKSKSGGKRSSRR
ncbi:hypothetical protein CPB86DRAFT_693663 [Serendipita vermifera]|nr:hypothetical protein CPB86DRAFT_693663 [Serendipita vermifera]